VEIEILSLSFKLKKEFLFAAPTEDSPTITALLFDCKTYAKYSAAEPVLLLINI
jgi:hypothetical protein